MTDNQEFDSPERAVADLMEHTSQIFDELDRAWGAGQKPTGPIGRAWTSRAPDGILVHLSLNARIEYPENGSTEGTTDLDPGIPAEEGVNQDSNG